MKANKKYQFGTKKADLSRFFGMGNNPMVGATVAVAVAVQEALAK